jgi:hypothetical protein
VGSAVALISHFIKPQKMNTKFAPLILFLFFCTVPVLAQTTDRKAEKERKRVAREDDVSVLVESKIFEFRANRAIPSGYKSVDLTTNPNFVAFSPDFIVSEMPFFGRAYSASYGGEAGLKFEGKPEKYTVERKKKSYEIEAKVRSTKDFYTINLSVSFNGSSSMSVSCNNRTTISYNGEIYPSKASE